MMDNPEGLLNVLIGDLLGTITGRFETKFELYYYQPEDNGPHISVVRDWLAIKEQEEKKEEEMTV
jgi:hypothetical protein